jgi:hypothetical protein
MSSSDAGSTLADETEALGNDADFSIGSKNGSESTSTRPGASVSYLPKATGDDPLSGEVDNKAQADEGLVVASFPKNGREEVRAILKTYKDCSVADVRVWVRSDDSRVVPTRKGLCIRVELLPDLLVAVAALVKVHDDERVQSAPAGERDDAAGGEE